MARDVQLHDKRKAALEHKLEYMARLDTQKAAIIQEMTLARFHGASTEAHLRV